MRKPQNWHLLSHNDLTFRFVTPYSLYARLGNLSLSNRIRGIRFFILSNISKMEFFADILFVSTIGRQVLRALVVVPALPDISIPCTLGIPNLVVFYKFFGFIPSDVSKVFFLRLQNINLSRGDESHGRHPFLFFDIRSYINKSDSFKDFLNSLNSKIPSSHIDEA